MQFTNLDLKEILKKTNVTLEQNQRKYSKHLQSTASRVHSLYLGEWLSDKRHGWGSCINQKGDKY